MEIGRKKYEWSPDGKPKCFKCGQFGHIGRNCTKKPQAKTFTCYNCGKAGHMSKDCRAPRKAKIRAITQGEEENNNEETEKKEDFQEGSE